MFEKTSFQTPPEHNKLPPWPGFNPWVCQIIYVQMNSMHTLGIISWTGKRVWRRPL